MSFLRQTAKRVLSACMAPRWLLTRGATASSHELPRLALTFDDGPHCEHTRALLDLLESLGVKATFFVVGANAAAEPDLVRRMAEAGHEVGNHTWHHHDPRTVSARQFLNEVCQTDAYLRRLTGRTPQTMRPPKGDLNWGKLTGLWKQGKTVALWNVDPRDYAIRSRADIVDWASAYEPRDGDVLLFHDNHPWALAAVEILAGRGIFDRFRAVTASEIVGRPIEAGLVKTELQVVPVR